MKTTKQAKPIKAWGMETFDGRLEIDTSWQREYVKRLVASDECYMAVVRVEIRVIGGKK